MKMINNKKDKIKIERLETIIYNIANYLNELYKNTTDNTYEHHKFCFGITKAEYKKYFKGE